MLAIFGPGDDGQPGVHGATLRGVVGDRVTQLRFLKVRVQETLVCREALARVRVGVQGAAHEQGLPGDGFDAQQVAVGQGPAGFACFDGVIVAGGYDQVALAGLGAVGDGDGRARADQAQADQVVADAAGQLAAQAVIGRHQQDVGALKGQGGIGGRGGVHHLLRGAAVDPGVLVILSQDRGVAVAQAEAGGLSSQGWRNRTGSASRT